MKQYRIRRWLYNWLTDFDINQKEQVTTSKLSVRESDDPSYENCLTFRVWFANGGRVVQTQRYDHKKDRSNTSMYVITHDQNFGEQIDKIIITEGLRS